MKAEEEENQFADGTGTEEDPFQIETARQLHNVRDHLDKHFIQIDNIDLNHNILSNESWYDSDFGWEPICQMGEWEPEIDFTGVYDGNGHKITNLFIEREDSSYIGLFATIDGAEIKNVSLETLDVSGRTRVGGLVGLTKDGIIENCSGQGNISGQHSWTGGLVGNNVGLISNSNFSGQVISGGNYVGGLAGMNTADIKNSYSTANIDRIGENNDNYGGLVGSNGANGVIEHCYATGNVNGQSHLRGLVGDNGGIIKLSFATGDVTGDEVLEGTKWAIGGLVGKNNNTIENSYATGNVSGTQELGALVGNISAGNVINSYAVGNVSGDGHSIGGLVGYAWSGIITENSYWNTDISGDDSAAGEGKTTVELKEKSTYVDWDFDDIWQIDDSYPYLK